MTTTTRRLHALAGSLCLISLLGLTACGGGSDDPKSTEGPSSGTADAPQMGGMATVALGASIYKVNCVVCHGAGGKGDGVGAAGLAVKPRDLTTEAYKYVPVADSAKETDAIVEYLKVGRISAGMPAYVHLKPEELQSLAMFVESIRPKPNFVESPDEDDGG